MPEETCKLQERIVLYAAAGYAREMIAYELGITRAQLYRHLRALDLVNPQVRPEKSNKGESRSSPSEPSPAGVLS